MVIEERKQRIKVYEEKVTEHKVVMEKRGCLSVTGVEDVEGFSDSVVTLSTNMGRLVIKGENLHINKLDVTDGCFSLDGKINSLEYLKKSGKKGGFLENLFR